jgi:hypothetical protein
MISHLFFNHIVFLTIVNMCCRGEVVAKCEHQEDIVYADIGKNFLLAVVTHET